MACFGACSSACVLLCLGSLEQNEWEQMVSRQMVAWKLLHVSSGLKTAVLYQAAQSCTVLKSKMHEHDSLLLLPSGRLPGGISAGSFTDAV